MGPIDNTSVFSFSKFTLSPCCLKTSFHSSSDSFNSSLSSATIARSSAYRSFRLTSFIDTFLLISSITTMNSRGLRALPCLRPMFTLNCIGLKQGSAHPVREDIEYNENAFENCETDCEIVWAQIKLTGSKLLNIASMYRPPN